MGMDNIEVFDLEEMVEERDDVEDELEYQEPLFGNEEEDSKKEKMLLIIY